MFGENLIDVYLKKSCRKKILSLKHTLNIDIAKWNLKVHLKVFIFKMFLIEVFIEESPPKCYSRKYY